MALTMIVLSEHFKKVNNVPEITLFSLIPRPDWADYFGFGLKATSIVVGSLPMA
jgi:hypothetical protein